jgi:hypothetical protein
MAKKKRRSKKKPVPRRKPSGPKAKSRPKPKAPPPMVPRPAFAARAVAQGVEVDFVFHAGDEDVTGKGETELGRQGRLTAEADNGAWVFEVTNGDGSRTRYLRTLARP